MSVLQLDEFKTRQRATWEGGDYSACSPYIAEVGELVVSRAGITPGMRVLDVGTGSGILAIAAAKLGFEPVAAFDSDAAAVEATRVNARENAVVLERVERANLRAAPSPGADVVAANLMRPLLLRVAQLMDERPSTLIVSGLLESEADEVGAAFAPLNERRRLDHAGWAALLLAP